MNRWLSASALVLGLTIAGVASAGEPDTVFLTNGGRARGSVMLDDPQGVTVQLVDGTVQKFSRAEVMRVEYANANATTPTPAPEQPRHTRRHRATDEDDDDGTQLKRRSVGLMITGIIMMPIGAITGTALGIAAARESHGDVRLGLGIGIGVSALVLGGGIVFTILGSAKVPKERRDRDAGITILPSIGPSSVGVIGTF